MKLVTIAALASTLCFSQDRDVPGWSTTQWGMTEAKFVALFPDQKLERGEFKDDRTGYQVTSLEIERRTFRANAGFKNGLLDSVVLLPSGSGTDMDFAALETAITQKYGKPLIVKTDDISRERRWVFPSTVITLTAIRAVISKEVFVSLFYEPSKKGPI